MDDEGLPPPKEVLFTILGGVGMCLILLEITKYLFSL